MAFLIILHLYLLTSKEEWKALSGLVDDRRIVIKQADKGSCMVVWCRDDYIKEANNQLEDKTVYKDMNFKETILSVLVDKSNKIFKNLRILLTQIYCGEGTQILFL